MKTKILTLALLFFTSFSLMAQVTGTVKEIGTLSPVANQTVHLMGDSLSGIYMTTTTNANGQFSFANVGVSSYYDVYTIGCNQSYVGQTITTTNAVVNLLICVGSGPSCSASFSSLPDTSNPKLIHFTDNSTGNPTAWTWNFGDGTTSNLQNPSHTYATNGSYTVSLSISSANCSDTTSSTITIGNSTTCQAGFYYIVDSTNINNILFFDVSTGNPTTWAWDFGDGTTSNVQNPTHTYANAGTYSVNLTISSANCQSNTSQNVIIAGGSTNYSVSGFVMAGSVGLDLGNVQLLNASTGAIVAQSGLDSNSSYHFMNIPSGNYLVFAIPSPNTAFTNYTATYYTNSTLWSSATTLSVNSNLTNKDISLFQIVPMAGSGSISGNLSTGSKGNVVGAVVNLLNNSNTPVASTISDMNGNYYFGNVADGTYKIWVEIAGKTTTPIIITINANNQTSTNNDFIVSGNTVIPKPTSINNVNESLSIKTYPNPVENNLNLALNLENKARVSIEVFDLTGQLLIISNDFDLQAGSQTVRINLNQLAKGSYILKVSENNSAYTQQLITKIR